MKRLILALLVLFTLPAYAWTLPDVIECEKLPNIQHNWDCTLRDVPKRLPYRMNDGYTRVLDSTLYARCGDGVCEYQAREPGSYRTITTDEYAGSIDIDTVEIIRLHRGYYLGMSADGEIVTYALGTGPAYNGPLYSKPNPAVDACVDTWIDAHRKEVGEDAMISYDQINEWVVWCKEGRKP